MDIRQWLENTADREPPDRSDDIDIPEKFRNDRPDGDQVGRSYRYKRKRASSDSSIIALRRGHRPDAKSPVRSSVPGHARRPQDGAEHSPRRESSAMPPVAIPDAPNKTYEKRARYKTRTDRYELKTKKQKRERPTHKDEERSRRRRKPRRKDDGGRTTGLVQSFQLKNIPKNNRLTLKPDTSAGLFKHGRASVQLTGKGAGLPDLVFNEMRFLQKPTEHQDESGRLHDLHTLRERNPRPDPGEEISAYFNAKTAVGGEQHGKRDGRGQRAKSKCMPHQSEPSKEVDQAGSLVKLPEKPFLGFGSRGARQKSNAGSIDDTSYYTWSESLKQPPTPHLRQAHKARTKSVGHVEPTPQLRGLRGTNNAQRCGPGKATYEITTEARNRNTDHGAWIRAERGVGTAHVEVYQPADVAVQHDRHLTPALQTTSQSLPRYPSSPPRFFKHRSSGIVPGSEQFHNYHTSDILRIRANHVKHDDAQARLHTIYDDHDKENQDPASSLSIDKALRQANVAAAAQNFFAPVTGPAPKADIGHLPDIRKMPSIKVLPRIRRLNRAGQTRSYETLLEHQTEHQKPSVVTHARWPPPNLQFTISNAERQHWKTAATENLASRAQQATYHQRPIFLQEEDALIAGFANIRAVSNFNNDLLKDWHGSSSVVDRHSTPLSSINEAQSHSISHRPATSAFSRVGTTRSGRARGLSIENDLYSERVDVQQISPIDDDLAGFWKPNVLY